jgi:hypothetical protein
MKKSFQCVSNAGILCPRGVFYGNVTYAPMLFHLYYKGVHSAVAKAIDWELLLRVQSLGAAPFVKK